MEKESKKGLTILFSLLIAIEFLLMYAIALVPWYIGDIRPVIWFVSIGSCLYALSVTVISLVFAKSNKIGFLLPGISICLCIFVVMTAYGAIMM